MQAAEAERGEREALEIAAAEDAAKVEQQRAMLASAAAMAAAEGNERAAMRTADEQHAAHASARRGRPARSAQPRAAASAAASAAAPPPASHRGPGVETKRPKSQRPKLKAKSGGPQVFDMAADEASDPDHPGRGPLGEPSHKSAMTESHDQD